MNLKYAAITFVAVVVTWVVHELAHWATGEALGNNMVMTLNACYPRTKQYVEVWHNTIVTLGRASDHIASSNCILFSFKKQSLVLLIPIFINMLIHAITCRSDELD